LRSCIIIFRRLPPSGGRPGQAPEWRRGLEVGARHDLDLNRWPPACTTVIRSTIIPSTTRADVYKGAHKQETALRDGMLNAVCVAMTAGRSKNKFDQGAGYNRILIGYYPRFFNEKDSSMNTKSTNKSLFLRIPELYKYNVIKVTAHLHLRAICRNVMMPCA
jgi:hypothetical protein